MHAVDKSLAEHINSLRNQLLTIENWELSETVEQISDTYAAMLKYHMQGFTDPGSAQMQRDLRTRLLSLQQRIHRLKRLKANPTSRYATAYRDTRDTDLDTLATRLELTAANQADHEECIVNLFRWALTSDQWRSGDYETSMQILTSDEVSDKAKAVMTAAVLLSNLEYFDERKMMFLLDAYLLDDKEISQRALIGILLSLRKDAPLIPHYPDIEARVDIMCDDETFVNDTYTILMQLQMSSLTDKIASKIREDIMPSIVKSSATLKKQMGMLEISDKQIENGENPEWTKASEENDSKAEDKIREMTDMQINGEDVYMATFAMLKSFPFFGEMAHWFYPFTIDDPSLSNIRGYMEEEKGQYVKALLNNSPFCNSDKYSLCLLTSSMAGAGFNAVASQMEAQMADLEEEERTSMLKEKTKNTYKTSHFSRSFIFDLYRFYNIYSFRSEFYNPFADAQTALFTPLHIAPLRKLSENLPQLLEHAEFLMHKEYYKDAIAEFELYAKNGEHTAELFQKTGFCYQKQQDWDKAKQNYIMADSIKPNSKWTLSHLGKVSLSAEDYTSALECYRQLCEIDEDNTHYLLRYAETLQKTQQTSEAISILYKANYLSPDSERIRRQLGTCLALTRETDKALDYLDSPLDKGIAYITAGKTAEAYTTLKTAYETTTDKTTFSRNYKEALLPYLSAGMLTPQQAELFYDALLLEI